MTLVIGPTDLGHLKGHTENCWPEEACALLIGKRSDIQNWTVTGVEIAENVAKNRAVKFEISPQTMINLEMKYLRQEQEIIGVFHSHPEGKATLSNADKKSMIDKDVFWLIANTTSGVLSGFCAYIICNDHDFQELPIYFS